MVHTEPHQTILRIEEERELGLFVVPEDRTTIGSLIDRRLYGHVDVRIHKGNFSVTRHGSRCLCLARLTVVEWAETERIQRAVQRLKGKQPAVVEDLLILGESPIYRDEYWTESIVALGSCPFIHGSPQSPYSAPWNTGRGLYLRDLNHRWSPGTYNLLLSDQE